MVIIFKSMAKYISKIHGYVNLFENSEQEKLYQFAMCNDNNTKLGVLLSCYIIL